ncbi:hypothetical protein HQ560_13535, partial [bacterium]|nr:hypothetical protein [bacterium]
MSQDTDRRPRSDERWPASLIAVLVCAVVGAGLLFWVLAVKLDRSEPEDVSLQAAEQVALVVEKSGRSFQPAVLWAYKAEGNFLASPVPTREGVLVSALGTLNTGVFECLAL